MNKIYTTTIEEMNEAYVIHATNGKKLVHSGPCFMKKEDAEKYVKDRTTYKDSIWNHEHELESLGQFDFRSAQGFAHYRRVKKSGDVFMGYPDYVTISYQEVDLI